MDANEVSADQHGSMPLSQDGLLPGDLETLTTFATGANDAYVTVKAGACVKRLLAAYEKSRKFNREIHCAWCDFVVSRDGPHWRLLVSKHMTDCKNHPLVQLLNKQGPFAAEAPPPQESNCMSRKVLVWVVESGPQPLRRWEMGYYDYQEQKWVLDDHDGPPFEVDVWAPLPPDWNVTVTD